MSAFDFGADRRAELPTHKRDEQVLQALTASIKEIGLLYPVIQDEDGTVIDGALRLEACKRAGKTPGFVRLANLPKQARLHTRIRRQHSPLEIADLVQAVAESIAPGGARRAPGTGRAQHAISSELETRFGVKISPRFVSYALLIARATSEEKSALADAKSMHAAHQLLIEVRHGAPAAPEETAMSLTSALKVLQEAKSIVRQGHHNADPLYRSTIEDLRSIINTQLAERATDALA